MLFYVQSKGGKYGCLYEIPILNILVPYWFVQIESNLIEEYNIICRYFKSKIKYNRKANSEFIFGLALEISLHHQWISVKELN